MKLTNLRKAYDIIARSTPPYDISPCCQISGLKSTGQIIRSRKIYISYLFSHLSRVNTMLLFVALSYLLFIN